MKLRCCSLYSISFKNLFPSAQFFSTATKLTLTLRPYQEQCIEESLTHLNGSVNQRICVSLPVGSGKTVIFSNLFTRLPDKGRARKTLILAHRKELLMQAYSQVSRAYKEGNVCIDQGSSLKMDPKADVIIASVATLGREPKDSEQTVCKRLSLYDPAEFKLIIIDEAHHASASTYQRILKYFKVFDSNSPTNLFGCTATLRRHDGISLFPTFQEIIFHLPVMTMINDGYLSDIKITGVKTNLDLGTVKMNAEGDDFNLRELSRKVDVSYRNDLILETYKRQAVEFKRKACLVFAVDVAHIRSLVETFREGGIEAYGIDSSTKTLEREEIVTRFRAGEIPVLVNCGIMTEGVDLPIIDMIIMARPTRSGVLLMQMLGRGMRLFEGKEYCLVIDFVDTIAASKVNQASLPTLLGLSPDMIFENTSLKSIGNSLLLPRVETEEFPHATESPHAIEVEPHPLPDMASVNINMNVTLSYIEKLFSAEALNHDQDFLRSLTRLAWTRVGPHSYILNVYSSFLSLEYDKKNLVWLGSIGTRYNGSNFHAYRKTAEDAPVKHDNLSSAFSSMETLALRKFGYTQIKKLEWNSSWRKGAPTDSQAKFLQKLGISNGVNNRGDASDIIAKRLHGAAGRWKAEFAAQKNAVKERKKEEVVKMKMDEKKASEEKKRKKLEESNIQIW